MKTRLLFIGVTLCALIGISYVASKHAGFRIAASRQSSTRADQRKTEEAQEFDKGLRFGKNNKMGSGGKKTKAGTPASRLAALKILPIPQGAPLSTNGASHAINELSAADTERSRLLIASLRTSMARSQTLARLSPEQRGALAQLDERSGGGVDLRVRPETGTLRFLSIPATPDANQISTLSKTQAASAAYDFMSTNRGLLLLSDPSSEMHLVRVERDDLNHTHLRFSQRYQGVEVWPSELSVHLNAQGRVEMLDGAYVPTPKDLPTKPALQQIRAVTAARASVPGGEAFKSSVPELIVYGLGDKPSRLAWRMNLDGPPDQKWLVVVDAATGGKLTAYNRVTDANVAGSGIDLLGVTRPLNVWQQNTTYYLVDTSKPMFDPSSTPPDNPKGAIVILDYRNQVPSTNALVSQITSSSSVSGWLPDGVSAAFALSQTFDYYRQRLGRNSIDGQGGTMFGVVRYDVNLHNAKWNTQAMLFGDAEPYAAQMDVVAHELTHGVTQYSASLVYQDQSGALNEAFSDIFGEMVEAWTYGTNDWVIGEGLSSPLRSLSNPGSLQFSGRPYPATMSQFIAPGDPILSNYQLADHGGVHENSTIIGHAFFMLSAGLNGSIGNDTAARIFYRALTVHLHPQSQFLDCRLACIASANELFGTNSIQAAKTAEAFDAVEIFDSSAQPPPPPNSTVSASDSAVMVYYDSAAGAWYLGRREDALGDPQQGVQLSQNSIYRWSRPSVTGDGTLAVFVNAQNDMSLIPTDGSASESNLGYPGQVHSVAVAPDGKHFGFVFQDAYGHPENRITYIDDSNTGNSKVIYLVAPATEGSSVNTILYADTMCLSPDNHYIVYDALNELQLSDGSTTEVWSIYAYDLRTGDTLTLAHPIPGLDVGNPALGHTRNTLITFEAADQTTGLSTVLAADLLTGALHTIGTVDNEYAFPCYSGDDLAIAYSQVDASANSGTSLFWQPLQPDHTSANGSGTNWVYDAALGFVYRRGTYTHPAPQANVDLNVTVSVGPASTPLGTTCTFTVTVSNSGPDGATGVTLTDTLPDNTQYVSGNLSQGSGSRTGNSITGRFGALGAGASATLSLVVNCSGTGLGRNKASVVSDQPDTNPADNNAFGDVTVFGLTLDVQASPNEGGTVIGAGVFAYGSTQTVSASPNQGYAFANWTSNGTIVSTSPDYTFTLTGDFSLVANFVPSSYTVAVASSPLGAGKVTGAGTFKPGAQRTVTASTSGNAYVFANWTENGAVVSTSASYSFTLNANRHLVANFIPNPFIPVAGKYNGLFYDPVNGVNQQSSGGVTFSVTSKGSFSGTALIGASRYAVSGAFDSTGGAVTTPRGFSSPTVTLQLDLSHGTDRIVGTISDGETTLVLSADRAVFDGKTSFAPQAGQYTIMFPGSHGSATQPGGDGYGTVTVSAAGQIRLSATLADGTKLSQTAIVSKYGQWPVYVPLYGAQGSVWGWINFVGTATNDLSGMVSWTKPVMASAAYYPGGFEVQTVAEGCRYAPPTPGNNALGLTAAQVVLSGGDLAQSISDQITLGVGSQFVNLGNNKLALSFTTSTGLFKGSMANPSAFMEKPVSFNGVVLSKKAVARGCFLEGGQSGPVWIGE